MESQRGGELTVHPQPILDVRNIEKSFGMAPALRSVSLSVQHGEFLAVLGPSGCGKTTLLRSIAGFEEADQGRIFIAGSDVTSAPPHRRPVNTVFQNFALFPHMTVFDNVAFGPRRKGAKSDAIKRRVPDALALVSLDGYEERFPHQLSGGQRQRVALARAIINEPKLLLLDEPLSALDLKLRRRMQLELKQLQKKLGIAFVFVTHDQEEALALADRVIVMNGGIIEQDGPPQAVYDRPKTRFVAEFVGDANFFPARWVKRHRMFASASFDGLDGARTMVRPENIAVIDDDTNTKAPAKDVIFEAFIADIASVGGVSTVFLQTADLPPVSLRDMSGKLSRLRKGDHIWAGFSLEHLHVIGARQ